MDFGRVVKVTTGDETLLYIVAEEDAGKAAAILTAHVASGSQIETLGRTSRQLLSVLAFSPGEFRKAQQLKPSARSCVEKS
jgi:hypothetical protein